MHEMNLIIVITNQLSDNNKYIFITVDAIV